MKKIFSLILSIMIIFTGCSKNIPQMDNEASNAEITITQGMPEDYSEEMTLYKLKEKYGVENEIQFKPFYNVDKNTNFYFRFKSLVVPHEAITVHTDPACDLNSTVWQYNYGYITKEGDTIVSVSPYNAVLNSKDRIDYEEWEKSWGHAPIYYLCIRYDLNSEIEKKLEEPIIIPFTIKHDVSTPNANFKLNSDGLVELYWEEVEEAVQYNVYVENAPFKDWTDYNGPSEVAYMDVDITLKKLATLPASELSYSKFSYDYITEEYREDFTESGNFQNQYSDKIFFITAVDANGKESGFSQAIIPALYANKIPYSVNKQKSFGINYNILTELPKTVEIEMSDKTTTQSFPAKYTKLEDYSHLTRDAYCLYKYEIQNTKLYGTVKYQSETGEYPDFIDYQQEFNTSLLSINYKLEDYIKDIPDNTVSAMNETDIKLNIEEELKELNIEKEIVYPRESYYGRTDVELTRWFNQGKYADGINPNDMLTYDEVIINGEKITSEPLKENQISVFEVIDLIEKEKANDKNNSDKTEESVKEIQNKLNSANMVDKMLSSTKEKVEKANQKFIPTTDLLVYADSAEEAYIALNLINCEEEIDLSGFPKLLDAKYLEDVLLKVHYQNPYHMGLISYYYDYYEEKLYLEYELDKETTRKQQLAILKEANNILSQIIKEDMTEEEKVLAIWKYLEANTEYDDAALKAAKRSQFNPNALNKYANSFNAYGIMCDKVGVCQSYAYVFKLLCDMSGVNAKVATGDLSPDLPHAWNFVQINGIWTQIDTTNNINTSGVPFLLYLADIDTSINRGFYLDDYYEIDTKLEKYKGTDNSLEYYEANHLIVKNKDDIYNTVKSKINILEENELLPLIWNGEELSSGDISSITRNALTDLYTEGAFKNVDKPEKLSVLVGGEFIVIGQNKTLKNLL